MKSTPLFFLALSIPGLFIPASSVVAGETAVVSLRDFRSEEIKSAGIKLQGRTTLHVTSSGARSGSSWISGTEGLFAAGWIISARTREPVWEMNSDNSRNSGDNVTVDERITLDAGEYEVYFAAPTFSYSTWKSHVEINIDHRKKNLFEGHDPEETWFFEKWLTDDLAESWDSRASSWGIDIKAEEKDARKISSFTPPAAFPGNAVIAAAGLKDNVFKRQGFRITEPLVLNVYALGEASGDVVDGAWIANVATGERIWEMKARNTHHAGGAEKNIMFNGTVRLPKGEFVLVTFTDGSHSTDDWNSLPPWDPFHWGVTVSLQEEEDRRKVNLFDYQLLNNVIVKLTKPGNNAYLQENIALREETKLRILSFGERSFFNRTLADYGYIMDSRTREKAWTMDIDRCTHAGGAGKNVMIDEVISLPKGSYTIVYKTDDSHAYGDWNDDPPFDTELYGITVMGASKDFNPAVVSRGGEPRDRRIIAQIVRVGDGADQSEKFRLSKPTRVRIYALGEGQKREMFDYGWIERQGTIIWEMTYGMTFHAGGGRKNRMVNTTILLEKGDYVLHFKSDDSHSFHGWNDDPPDDQEFWGITLYNEPMEAPAPPGVPAPPATPEPTAPPEPEE